MKIPIPSLLILALAVFWQWPLCAGAWHPRLEEQAFLDGANPAPVVGVNRPYLIGPGDSLVELARRSGTGYQALVRANPDTDPWLPRTGTEIFLPYSFILPRAAAEGITINLAEQRLYHIWREAGRQKIRVYAVGIGREGWNTPLGKFSITSKVSKPSWTPPPSIRARSPGMPALIPPGPNNPLGDYWLGLSVKGYGIHGTTKPFGVGRRVSHGCLRLYPEDIEDLFQRVEVGTPVRIIDQPIKVGLKDELLYLEVHSPVTGRTTDPVKEVLRQVSSLPWQGNLDMPAIRRALQVGSGIPTPISHSLENVIDDE